EQLVERAEAAGEDDEPLGGLHEADLASVEVLERVADVDVGVRALLVRQLDVEADRESAPFLHSAVGRLHHARPAAGDHRPARLAETAPDLAGVTIGLGVLAHARGAEDRDRGSVDPVHGREAGPELPGDREDVLGERALVGREEPLVVCQRSRSGSTCVAFMPSTSRIASPKYRTAIVTRRLGVTR